MRLRRAFGFGNTSDFDPFLLFDDFRNDNPDAYLAGFPWHPHRGIETITYVLAGTVEHGDSLGNRGQMGAGDVQWMTAGSGILHQEMPKGDAQGRMHGFQLWSNLPVVAQDDEAALSGHLVERHSRSDRRRRDERARSSSETSGERADPVEGVAADPRYLDISVPPGKQKRIAVDRANNAFAYVFAGSGTFRDASDPQAVATEQVGGQHDGEFDYVSNRSLVLFDRGDEVVVQAGDQGIRFLLVSGKPLEEPVAWRGPIVMNTNGSCSRRTPSSARARSSSEKGSDPLFTKDVKRGSDPF